MYFSATVTRYYYFSLCEMGVFGPPFFVYSKFYYLCAMAKKKMTRDIPLPSSDGLFGGPGDPKKKYTAKDSNQFMQTEARLKKNIDKFRKQKTDPSSSITSYVNTKNLINRQVDSLQSNPFFKTRVSRMNKK